MADRNQIWALKKNLKGTSVVVREDYSKETSKYISTLIPVMKAARKANLKSNIVGDILIVNGKKYPRGHLSSLPTILQDSKLSTSEDENGLAFYGKASPFSNFYQCNFTVGDTKYSSVEQFYQSAKANLNNQINLRDEIMRTNDPAEQKRIGSRVILDQQEWEKKAADVMHSGLMAKFSQNASLCKALLNTNQKALYEASPKDLYWGIGMSLSNSKVLNPRYHTGQNILGKVLMTVRSQLAPDATDELIPNFTPPNYNTPSVEMDLPSNSN
jgi:hypothetical protein